MNELLRLLAWEWVNITLEYTATAGWARLSRWGATVAGVNLVTHPVLMLVLARFGYAPGFVAACEGVVLAAEWGMLCAVYRGVSRLRLLGLAAAMNVASYATGMAL
ncbi:MAG: hypothetical protein IKO01_06855 [Kiritimatiellae bacterium]|nr:hypothetical protein [Kiritimatiellia bacterium]